MNRLQQWDRATLEKDGFRVAIRKNIRDDNGNITDTDKNWVITAFDNERSKKEKEASAATLATPNSNEGGRAVASDTSSTGKDNTNSLNQQENGEKKSAALITFIILNRLQRNKNALVTIDIDTNKTHIEVVGWRSVRDESVEQIKNRAMREGGQVLITQKGAAGLSALIDGPVSASKDTGNSSNQQENGENNSAAGKIYPGRCSMWMTE